MPRTHKSSKSTHASSKSSRWSEWEWSEQFKCEYRSRTNSAGERLYEYRQLESSKPNPPAEQSSFESSNSASAEWGSHTVSSEPADRGRQRQREDDEEPRKRGPPSVGPDKPVKPGPKPAPQPNPTSKDTIFPKEEEEEEDYNNSFKGLSISPGIATQSSSNWSDTIPRSTELQSSGQYSSSIGYQGNYSSWDQQNQHASGHTQETASLPSVFRIEGSKNKIDVKINEVAKSHNFVSDDWARYLVNSNKIKPVSGTSYFEKSGKRYKATKQITVDVSCGMRGKTVDFYVIESRSIKRLLVLSEQTIFELQSIPRANPRAQSSISSVDSGYDSSLMNQAMDQTNPIASIDSTLSTATSNYSLGYDPRSSFSVPPLSSSSYPSSSPNYPYRAGALFSSGSTIAASSSLSNSYTSPTDPYKSFTDSSSSTT